MRLINGDCITEMQKLIDEDIKVDLVLTDPPYGTTDCKWDNIISFDDMWICLNHLSTDITSGLFFGSEPFSTKLRSSNLNNYKYDLYWVKNNSTGYAHAKNKPLKEVELISVFSKGAIAHKTQSNRRMTYNPQGLVKINKKIQQGKYRTGKTMGKRPSHKKEWIREYSNYPKSCLNFKSVPIANRFHSAQKPVDLLEYLIKTYSNEGDTVLDFTMGSGSTGVACMNTNRNFIGIELDKSYYDIAVERINNYQSKLI